MKFSTSLKFAGEVNLKEAKLYSLNGQTAIITNQIIAIEMYENIFSPIISMNIVLKEAVDFLNLFPFCGEEYVSLNIETPTLEVPIKAVFYVYKISDRMYTAEREVVYTLKCASVEFLADSNIKITKAFSGNIVDNVKYLVGKDGLNTTKPVLAENTSNETKFVANFWNPIKCISYLSSRAINSKGSPTYAFYENRDGFNFRTLNEILTQTPIQEFVKDNYTRTASISDNNIRSYNDILQDYKRILDIKIPVVTDYIDSIQSGQLRSRLITHDIVTKKYMVKEYSVKTDPNRYNLLNNNPLYSKYAIANSSSTILTMPKHFTIHNNYKDITNSESIQRRLSFFQGLEKFKVVIDVIGRTDYTVGRVVELNIPRVTQITKEDSDYRDAMVSGKYLISSCTHVINRERHVCKMELVKNSVITNLSTQ